MRFVPAIVLFSCSVLAAPVPVETTWPQFRGVAGRGVAEIDPARLPTTWTATSNVAWKADIPGRGWSSPIVWGEVAKNSLGEMTLATPAVTGDGLFIRTATRLYRIRTSIQP